LFLFSCKSNSLVLTCDKPFLSLNKPVVCFRLCFLQAKPIYTLFSEVI
ncbi:unnamed protein product, partial [Brassica oleracea]